MEKREKNTGAIVQTIALLSLPPLLLVYLLQDYIDVASYGMTQYATIGRLTFHFLHGSIFHLLLNWWIMVNVCFAWYFSFKDILWMMLLVSCYPFVGGSAIVGMSGLLYAMLGMIGYKVRKWDYTLSVMAFIGAGCIFSNIAWGLHLWGYSVGNFYGWSKDIQRRIKD